MSDVDRAESIQRQGPDGQATRYIFFVAAAVACGLGARASAQEFPLLTAPESSGVRGPEARERIDIVQLLQPEVDQEPETESEPQDSGRRESPGPLPLPSPSQPMEDDLRDERDSPFASAFSDFQRQPLQTPWMFGPSFLAGRLISLERTPTPADDVEANLPFSGDNGHARMSVNNRAQTDNRVFFLYQHFHNALDVNRFPPAAANAVANSFGLDRFLLGWETATADGLSSVELRLPLFAGADIVSAPPGGAADFRADSGALGNLAVILKRILYDDCCTSIAAGMGITLPTGDDVRGQLPALNTTFLVNNDAVHLLPYLGFLRRSNDTFFYQGFAQLDIAANGNRVEVFDLGTPAAANGVLDPQTLMFLDISAGWWLYRNPCSCRVTGLASLIELHYTTTLESADRVVAAPTPPTFTNLANRIDAFDLTCGLHFEFGPCSSLRVGGVFPLRSGDNRFFDSEIQLQLNRRY